MFQLLIVDDETNVVDSLADTLNWKELNIDTVFKAYSGFEALDILKTNNIDIVLTDIRMPGMNGLELLATIERNWRRTKCILLSGHAEFTYAQQAIRYNSCDYLLKPVSDEEIIQKVSGVVERLRKEREENRTYEHAVKVFRENLPRIRGDMLSGLLQGKRYSSRQLAEELEMVELKLTNGTPFALMLVRLEENFEELDFFSRSLMEYAIGNITQEIFEGEFQLWACKDVHNYLVFLVWMTQEEMQEEHTPAAPSANAQERFQFLASQLQISVKHYLKGTVSVLASVWGEFPQDASKLYQDMLSSLLRQLGDQRSVFISVSEETEQQRSVHVLQTLYEPPMLVHLLESGDWKAVREKLEQIIGELEGKRADSLEHLIEVFFFVYSAFSSFAHKNNRKLEEIIGPELADVSGMTACRSIPSLRKWVLEAFDLLQRFMENEAIGNREAIIKKIQNFVQKHLVEDVSLQAIADHMYMHPVHVSRIYKLGTGENISDYVFRSKMERAAVLLTNSPLKNYEISLQLGYQNPNYFIKVFKKYYSITPQEFRLKLTEGK